MNGRGSGTRDEWIAATYIAAQLRRFDIEPLGDAGGFVQEVTIERSELIGPPILSVAGKKLAHGVDMSVLAIGGAKLSGPLQKFREGTPVNPGAVLLLPETNPPPSDVTLSARIVLSLETEPLRTRRIHGPARAITITRWGRLTGSGSAEAREVILLSAHLDHIGSRPSSDPKVDTINNGADDDASGSVAVLELVKATTSATSTSRTWPTRSARCWSRCGGWRTRRSNLNGCPG